MTSRRARATARRARLRRLRAAGLLVLATTAVVLGHQLTASSSSTAAAPLDAPRRGGNEGSAGAAGLDPALLEALRRAATAAAADGVGLHVDSGRRSPEEQDRLFREAVAEYGSEEEAARWVATAETSAHVSGDAIDIGPAEAAAWLSEHGAAYGLCQIYGNEPWHFELRPGAVDHGCPPMYADPTHDPRLRR